MIIGRLILAFITALSRIIPGIKPPQETLAETGRKGGATVAVNAPVHASVIKEKPKAEKEKPATAPEENSHSKDLSEINGIVPYLKELAQRFTGDQCPAWAAALSFFSLLSLPPILLCALAVLGYVIKSPQVVAQQTEQVVAKMLPGKGAQASAKSIIQQLNVEKSAEEVRKRRGITGVIGIALLFWSALQIFVNASTPMNAAFRAKETRGWIKLRVVALGLLIGCGVLFLLSLLPSAGIQALNSIKILNLPDPSPAWLDFVALFVGIGLNTALFTVIYRFLPSPSANVNWRDARYGGIIAAFLWEAAKQGFALYLQRMNGQAGYDKVYGSLGGLVLLVFWIYYTSMILLLGAELAKLNSDLRHFKEKQNATPTTA